MHNLTKEVVEQLRLKHPLPGSQDPSVLPDITSELPDPVLFEGIDALSIQNAAKDIDGAGGPSQVSAQIWKHMICSKFHLKESEKLAQTIADFVKILCTEQVPSQYLAEFLAGRSIPLDKDPGSESPEIRPIGAQHECTSSSVLGGKRSQLCLCCRPTHSPSGSPIRTISSIRCGAGTAGY